MASPKIFWTKDERESVSRGLIKEFTVNPLITRRAALSNAQSELLLERRRRITDQVVHSQGAMINAAKKAASVAAFWSKPEPVTAPVPVKAPEPVEMSLGALFEKLVDEITRRVTLEVRKATAEPEPQPRFQVSIQRGNAELRERMLNMPTAKPRKVSVLIIGLNGSQMSTVTTKYPDFKLTFLTAEEGMSHHRVKADHTILMTKFINHSVQGKYRQVPNLHYCNGGVSDLGTLMHIIQKPVWL